MKKYLKKFYNLILLEIVFLSLIFYPVSLSFKNILFLSKKVIPIVWNTFSPFFCGTIDPITSKIYFVSYLIFVLVSIYLFYKFFYKEKVLYFRFFTLILFIFMLALFFTFLFFPFYTVLLTAISIFFFLTLFAVLINISDFEEEKILDAFIFCGIFIGFIGFFQYFKISFGILEISSDFRRNVASTLGHNTATSFVVFHTVLLILWRKRRVIKFYFPFLIILFFVFIVCQSRGVYLLFIIDLLIFILFYREKLNLIFKKLNKKYLFSFLLFFVMAVLSQSFKNPLLLSSKTLIRRLYDFSPSILIKGTRFRIYTICLYMIKKHPLKGYGISSFKFYYPFYQGEYFFKNPDSILVPSDKKTERAHNDWLQLFVEIGVPMASVIFILYLLSIYFFIKRKKVIAVIFFTNFFLQSMWDFPWHLPFLAFFMLFFIAYFVKKYAGKYLETFHIKFGECFLIISALVILLNLICNFYYADYFLWRAFKYIRLLRSNTKVIEKIKKELYVKSLIALEKAWKYNPYDADINYYTGGCYLFLGKFRDALFYFNMAREENSYHFFDYRCGVCYYFLKDIKNSLKNLDLSIFKAPTFEPSYKLELKIILKNGIIKPEFFKKYEHYFFRGNLSVVDNYLIHLVETNRIKEFKTLLANSVVSYGKLDYKLLAFLIAYWSGKDVKEMLGILPKEYKYIYENLNKISEQSLNGRKKIFFYLLKKKSHFICKSNIFLSKIGIRLMKKMNF